MTEFETVSLLNRRRFLRGALIVAAPMLIRIPGLLMPVHRVPLDPGDINGIFAEMRDGTTWHADPNIAYWADGYVNIAGKKTIKLHGATVTVRTTVNNPMYMHVKDCCDISISDFTFNDAHIQAADKVAATHWSTRWPI